MTDTPTHYEVVPLRGRWAIYAVGADGWRVRTGDTYTARYKAENAAAQLNEDEPCDLCAGTGYLIDQTYGTADIPEDWTPVQACDQCEDGQAMSDEEAAMCAANDRDDIDRRVHYAYFPGALNHDDEREPGDWAIGPNQ